MRYNSNRKCFCGSKIRYAFSKQSHGPHNLGIFCSNCGVFIKWASGNDAWRIECKAEEYEARLEMAEMSGLQINNLARNIMGKLT